MKIFSANKYENALRVKILRSAEFNMTKVL